MTENQYFSKIAIDLIKDYTKRGYENAVACIDWLKKISQEDSTCSENQGDKNPCETCEESRLNCQNFPCEKKKNFDSVNKVEPKFHEGDWILYSGDHYEGVRHITKINENGYYIERNGLPHGIIPFDHEICMRLWTIQDAKPGDVLACNDNPFLFLKYEKDEYGLVCCSYCGISNSEYDEFAVNTNTKKYWCDIEFVNPATKEQRELLFQKMKEAGYTFDFEKKELKKIEDEEYNGEDYGIDSLFHAQRILEKTLGNVDGYQSDDGILEHKCAIAAVKKLYEQKPTEWSSEDEKMLNHIISIIENVDDNLVRTENISIYVNWLKSLKDRAQSKHEWSEDDERTYKSIMYSFDHNYPLTIQQQEFVKSLRPQKQWKPSDEQMLALDSTLQYSQVSHNSYENLNSLYNDLKKLTE